MIDLSHIPREPGVYGIRFIATGKLYVGASQNMRSRISGHFSELRSGKHPSPRMREAYAACQKTECFVIEQCRVRSLNRRELHWIKAMEPALNSKSYSPVKRGGERTKPDIEKKAIIRNFVANSKPIDFSILTPEEISSLPSAGDQSRWDFLERVFPGWNTMRERFFALALQRSSK